KVTVLPLSSSPQKSVRYFATSQKEEDKNSFFIFCTLGFIIAHNDSAALRSFDRALLESEFCKTVSCTKSAKRLKYNWRCKPPSRCNARSVADCVTTGNGFAKERK